MRALVLCVCAGGLSASALGDGVYSNDFSSQSVGSEWQFANAIDATSVTPGGAIPSTAFLGEFSGQAGVTLNLGTQAAGTYRASFDLYLIRSWDGNGELGAGPDSMHAGYNGSGNNLLDATFANWPGQTQSFPKPVGGGTFAAGTGAAAVNALGYTIFGNPLDSVYHMEFTFAHAGGALSLNWSSTLNQFADDESWGLDNIVVQSVPAPGTLAGLAGAMLLTGRRRRK